MNVKTWAVKNRRLVVGAAVVVLALGGFWAWKATHGSSKAELQTATVVVGTIQQNVTAQGKLEPSQYVNIGAQVSGMLQKLYVQTGDTVTPSQIVAEIDPRVYQAKVDQAEASLASLKAQTALAQLDYDRNVKMAAQLAVSQQVLDTAKANLKALQAQIKQGQSALEEDQTDLGYTKIFAPMGGTVVSTSVKVGQTINSSQQAPNILEIANMETMTVRAQVAEADVARLRAGMPVNFTTLSGDRTWKSEIGQVLPDPENVNDVVLYDVLVNVDNSDGALMNGMSTQMNFVLAEAKDVATIPVAALGHKVVKKQHAAEGDSAVTPTAVADAGMSADGQPYRVKVLQNGKVVGKTVMIGLMDRTVVEVKSGLNVGDVVVLGTGASGGGAKSGGGGGKGAARMMGPRI